MKKNIFLLVGLFVIIIINAFAFAQKNHIEKTFFNVEFANKTFDSIQKNLAARSDYTTLMQYTQQLDDLQNVAKKCVSNAESNLKIIHELLKSTQTDHVTQLQQADSQYLQGKELHYAKQLSDCRLFIYRSQEALTEYKNSLQKLSAYQILRRGTPIWKIRENRIELIRTLYITLLSAVTLSLVLLWRKFLKKSNARHPVALFFSSLCLVAIVFLVVSEWLGYHRFAVFTMLALCLTILYTIAAIVAWRLIDVCYQWIDNKQYATARKIHQIFGVKFSKKMHEVMLIKTAAFFTVLCFYVVAILKSWSISVNFVDVLIDSLLYGFKFLGMTIIPLRIVLALLSFSVILLTGRFIATSIAKKQHFKGEEDTQIAIATITIYVSFAIALLFALLVTGVDFTGLAIIAGALSVGVGLGLQNIVNNFVSGLILLIEKPIKPGDRIVIGKTEGFVRKIRIRSTQIATLAKEDVIVPNADFMTQQVTNYMFRDRNSRVTCQVGVAYQSDVVLVKKLLLEVAAKHEDVVHEAPNEPIVLFSRFGDNGLIFDLWCVIHDVNKKFLVVSDLNFAIDAAFRHHNITIAYPQRDLHINGLDIYAKQLLK